MFLDFRKLNHEMTEVEDKTINDNNNNVCKSTHICVSVVCDPSSVSNTVLLFGGRCYVLGARDMSTKSKPKYSKYYFRCVFMLVYKVLCTRESVSQPWIGHHRLIPSMNPERNFMFCDWGE